MRHIIFLLIASFSFSLLCAEPDSAMWKKLKAGHILAYSEVETQEGIGPQSQSLDYKIYGLHSKKCDFALKKISRYEKYSEFIDFVKSSKYDESSQTVFFDFSSMLLPYDMLLSFKLPRIESPGLYTFTFEKGFLRGLVGTIEVKEQARGCFFHGTAKWIGPDSGIPDSVFAFFSKNLGKAAMERIFRFSSKL